MISDTIIAVLVILGVFLAMYMAWRQQGIAETVNEIKEAFQDTTENAKEAMVYR